VAEAPPDVRPATPSPSIAAGGFDEAADFGALNRTGGLVESQDDEAGGFAEVLFAETRSRVAEEAADTADGSGAGDEAPEDMPIGGIFATGCPDELGDDEAEVETKPLNFRSSDQPRRSIGTPALVLMVTIAALIIALIMAHVTGLAPWATR
jgi:hypothetical protein